MNKDQAMGEASAEPDADALDPLFRHVRRSRWHFRATEFFTPQASGIEQEDRRNSSVRIAAAVSERIHEGLVPEAELLPLTPSNWRRTLDYGAPDLLIVDSAWTTVTGHWTMSQVAGAADGDTLAAVVRHARAIGIPTVFWFTWDGDYHEHFAEFAREFDQVYCADPTEPERLGAIGVPASYLPPAVQPAAYTPVAELDAGATKDIQVLYDGWLDLIKYPELADLLEPLATEGLAIVDSAAQVLRTQLERTPEGLRDTVLGYLSPETRPSALRRSKVYLSAEPTNKTLTERTWLVMQAAGSRVPVLHRGGAPAQPLFADIPLGVEDDDTLAMELVRLLSEDLYSERRAHALWRHVLDHHTFAHRLRKICDDLGIANDWVEHPPVTLVTPTFRPDLIEKCLAQYDRQTYPNKELVLVFNGDRDQMPALPAAYADRADITYCRVPRMEFAGTCLNIGAGKARGEFVFRVDDDDTYGDHYVADMMKYLKSVHAQVLGKVLRFVEIESDDCLYTYRNDPGPAAAFSAKAIAEGKLHLSGCTLAFHRDVLRQWPYPADSPHAADVGMQKTLGEFAPDMRCIRADSLNLVVHRFQDVSRHTWRIAHDELLKTMRRLGSGRDHVLV